MTKKLKYKFPENFFWGTATSAHQIEGNNENQWSEWEKQGHIKDGSISGRACNSYQLYKKDVELIKELNNNAYRFSIEWSRIEPKQGQFDKDEISHYKKVIKECKENNIEPFITIYHWTMPLWFAEQGGWLNKNAPTYFKRYTEKLAEAFGQDVKYWCTINEPMIYAFNSYLKGKWVPQKKSFLKFRKVLRNLVKAHKLAYDALHKNSNRCQVSIAKNNQFFEAYSNDFINKTAVKFLHYYWNESFLNKIKNELDYIGLNYYFHNRLKISWNFYELKNKNKITNDMGWEIYPEGIYHVLKNLEKYNLPIYILENGLADAKDEKRADFIVEHLRYIHKAIQSGVDVRGYFHWSLLDNFEWAEGYEPKFGLYAVDFKTFERKARGSAGVYGEIAKSNGF